MQVVDAKQGRIYISRDTYYLRTCSFPSKLGSAVAKLVNFHTGKSSNTKFVFVFFFFPYLEYSCVTLTEAYETDTKNQDLCGKEFPQPLQFMSKSASQAAISLISIVFILRGSEI